MNTYGLFQITALTIGVYALVVLATLALAIRLYFVNKAIIGVIVHLFSIVLMGVLVMTFWTSIDWMALDIVLTILAGIVSVALFAASVYVAVRFIGYHEPKVRRHKH